MFLEDQIIGDTKKSDESRSSPEIFIIPISISSLAVHDDHGGAGEDNNDSPIELIEQAPPEPLAPPVKPELRRFARERQLITL